MVQLARWCVAATFAVAVLMVSAPYNAEGSSPLGGCTPFPPDFCCGCWQFNDEYGNPSAYCFDSTSGFSECGGGWCPIGNHDCGLQQEQ